MMSRFLIFFMTYTAQILSSSSAMAVPNCPFKPDLGQNLRRYTGRYENPAFGYSLTIPAGIVGLDTNDPSYQRGFLIPQGKNGTFSIYAQSNSADFNKSSKAAKEYINGLSIRASRIQNVVFKKTFLDSNSASLVSANFRCNDSIEPYSLILMTALNRDRQFVYTIAWEGKSSEKIKAFNIMISMGKSWQFAVPK